MNDVAIVSADMVPCRSPLVEKALRELAQMPLTEACVAGLCDICLYQTGLCNIVGPAAGGFATIQAFRGIKK
jgi:hypothetical protein